MAIKIIIYSTHNISARVGIHFVLFRNGHIHLLLHDYRLAGLPTPPAEGAPAPSEAQHL